MSNGNTAIPVSPVTDMVAALNAALASHAKVPELEASLSRQSDTIDKLSYHNQRLEENILGYKNQIAELTSKVRSLEVERDDAGFHALEAEDKLTKLLEFMRNAATAMDDEIRFIDPPKPIPNVAEAPKADEVKGSSEANPFQNNTPQSLSESGSSVQEGTKTESNYQPFTPPAPTAKPVEITEGSQSNEHPSTGPSSTNEKVQDRYW